MIVRNNDNAVTCVRASLYKYQYHDTLPHARQDRIDISVKRKIHFITITKDLLTEGRSKNKQNNKFVKTKNRIIYDDYENTASKTSYIHKH